MKLRDTNLGNSAHFKYKQYINLLLILLKRSKQFNDLKNSWKGIKNLISFKRTSNSVHTSVTENNIKLNKPKDIANAFNKYL